MRVTKADLRGFGGEAVELILQAQEQGAEVRKISNRGHAILMRNGRTCSVPPKLKLTTRTGQNARAGVRRLFKDS